MGEHRVGHRGPEDDGQVVRGGGPGAAGAVQAGRGRRVRVDRPQRGRFRVHHGYRGVRAAQHLGQRVGGVVTRNQQQRVE